jgi:hypothetical protein
MLLSGTPGVAARSSLPEVDVDLYSLRGLGQALPARGYVVVDLLTGRQ